MAQRHCIFLLIFLLRVAKIRSFIFESFDPEMLESTMFFDYE